LRRLLNQDIFRHIKNKTKDKNDPSMFIFTQGKPVDFFVLILEGRVEVTVGRESLIFEGGPFTHFGLQALAQNVGFDSPSQQFNQGQTKGSLQSLNMDAMLVNNFENMFYSDLNNSMNFLFKYEFY
jgi:metal transporter CNNM